MKESLWREYCILCLQDGRTPNRDVFEAWIDPNSTYNENLSLIRERLKIVKGPSKAPKSHVQPMHHIGIVLLLLSVATIFMYRPAPEVDAEPVSAMEAFAVAASSASTEFEDARLVSVISGNGSETISGSFLNPRQYSTDGKSFHWYWTFHSLRSGRIIQITTSGKTVQKVVTAPYGNASSGYIGSEAWRIDSTGAVNIATRIIENSWRSDGLVPVELELLRSQERNAVLWFVTLLPRSSGRSLRGFIVVMDAGMGDVLFLIERNLYLPAT